MRVVSWPVGGFHSSKSRLHHRDDEVVVVVEEGREEGGGGVVCDRLGVTKNFTRNVPTKKLHRKSCPFPKSHYRQKNFTDIMSI
jgi:hypothetical protein